MKIDVFGANDCLYFYIFLFFTYGGGLSAVRLSMLFKLFDFLKTVFRQKLIKNDAGVALDPSRKMRLEKCCRQRPESIRNDLYGESYGNFTETDQYRRGLL